MFKTHSSFGIFVGIFLLLMAISFTPVENTDAPNDPIPITQTIDDNINTEILIPDLIESEQMTSNKSQNFSINTSINAPPDLHSKLMIQNERKYDPGIQNNQLFAGNFRIIYPDKPPK